ncbi:MAG TPA: PQQ-dependent sugar dehydrogenase [Candidatus Limnocylindria bacterium]|nr:PQQ-dependent sugar dehydrogenase [Candidatus Limnocylindria bacterium]
MRRRSLFSLPLTFAVLASVALPAPAAAAPTLRATAVQDRLSHPWDIAFAPDGQMFVTTRGGRVRVYRSGSPDARLLESTAIENVRAVGESGVMGIAIDPNFAANRYVYVCASRDTNMGWRNQVIRYRVNARWHLVFNRFVIRSGMRANTIHNGCAVEIGPDGKVWVSMGDANNRGLAQNPRALNGKILRVNRDGSVPSDNPIMPGTSRRSFVYSMGHRNPQGIAFHPATDRVYAIEHGPERSDEINLIRPGRNYGWPCVAGYTAYNMGHSACAGDEVSDFVRPIWHSGSSTIATSGATFVSGTNWGSYARQLFVSQLKEQDVRRFRIDNEGRDADYLATHFNDRWGRLRAAVLGSRNHLYLTTSNGSNDRVIRVAPLN